MLTDNLICTPKPSTIADFPYKIYYSDYPDSHPLNNPDFQEFWNALLKEIKKLVLNENEGVCYYQNSINIVLNPDRDLISILNWILGLINANPAIFSKSRKEKIFKKNIPQNMQPLIPLLKKWSIPDDSEREQLMEGTSEKQKKKLVKTIWPYMVEINNFLDSFGDEPLSHEAILLGNLAELISELSIS